MNIQKIPSLTKKNYVELDKFYTKKTVAEKCYNELLTVLKMLKRNKNTCFIEPSAGSGVFLDIIGHDISIGFDLEPTSNNIIKNDFLIGDISSFITDNTIFIGNPPFGKKSDLAIKFINRSFEYSDIVAFILPVQFRKWNTQKKINMNAKLILDMDLDDNSFELYGEDYSVRCCFQIWTLSNLKIENQRIKEAPPTEHSDFKMYQYNNTKGALKYFDYDWDFAVLRQGWGDYSTLFTKKEDLQKSKQWIFFKAKNKEILKKLKEINFDELACLNTSVKGFGKADVIKKYISLYK